MIVVQELRGGTYKRISGNPIITSLDGKTKAPLLCILHPTWTDGERAKYGIYIAVPVDVPEGCTRIGESIFEKVDGVVYERCRVDVIPTDPPMTAQEKVSDMLARYDITLDELKAALEQ